MKEKFDKNTITMMFMPIALALVNIDIYVTSLPQYSGIGLALVITLSWLLVGGHFKSRNPRGRK